MTEERTSEERRGFLGLERINEGLLWWVILVVVFLINFEFIAVTNETAIYVLAVVVGAFNFIWHHVFVNRYQLGQKIYWEIIVQILFVAGLVNLTGGVRSHFYFVYFLPLVTATIVLTKLRVTMEVVGVASLLTVGEAFWGMSSESFYSALPTTALKVFALVTVGAYAGELGVIVSQERKERERAHENMLRQAERMALTHKIAGVMNSSLDVQETFSLMAREAKKIVPFDRISIAVPVDSGKRMELMAVAGAGQGLMGKGFTCPLGGTVLYQVMERAQPVAREDLTRGGDFFLTSELLLGEGIRSHIALPLVSHGMVLGTLNLASKERGLVTPENLEVLRPIAEQVAAALAQYQLFERVKMESITDGLTGIYNHRYFQEQLEIEIKKAVRADRTLALLMADLDNFKIFNDINGHVLGDEALRNVAAIIKGGLRTEDLVARYGGEEFVIVLPEVDAPRAAVVAERVRQRVEGFPFQTRPEAGTRLTLSIGVAVFPYDAHSRELLVKRADQALYLAKRAGRNQVFLFGREGLTLGELSPEELVKQELSLGIIHALAAAVDAKDSYTYRHSEAVSKFASGLARKLGLSEEETALLKMAGLVHDIGKIGIANEVLNKPGRLSPEEMELIKEHPRIGCNILRHVPSLHPVLPAVLHHHELYDGSGYPCGLKEDDIPLGARVLCLADAFHAMISDRPYRPALSQTRAVEELKSNAGQQFDPGLVATFISILAEPMVQGEQSEEP